MTTIHDAMLQARSKFKDAHIDSAELDARLLMQHVLEVDHSALIANQKTPITKDQLERFETYVSRRLTLEPISHMIGTRDFWKDSFAVCSDVLDPRADSETLIEAMLAYMPDTTGNYDILDMGCGSGCLGLSLLREYHNATLTALDISEKALEIAKSNAKRLKLAERCVFQQDNWGKTLQSHYDMVICNPPYITDFDIEGLSPEVRDFEPKLALSGGECGLQAYRELMPHIKRLLHPNGVAVIELGAGQYGDVSEIAHNTTLVVKEARKDLGGIDRALVINQP